MIATICRKASFNAAHRLHNTNWNEQQNMEVFGKCNNPNYHGHNYDLVIKITGEIKPETGYVVDAKILNEIIQTEIIERFDHKNLNLDTQDFKTLNPTTENIAVIIYNLLIPKIENLNKLTILLYETERNYVEYSGE